jgi:hypothetical protein
LTQVDNIINHVRNDEIRSDGISKFNYYGKKYRFEEHEEKMKESLNVPPPEVVQVSKTVQSIQAEEVPSTKTEAPRSVCHERVFPEVASMPMKYRIVFEKTKDNVALIEPPDKPTFPSKEKILESKIVRLQKELNELKSTQSRFGNRKSIVVEKVDENIPTRQKKDGKIRLDSYFFDSNYKYNIEYAE